MDKSPDAFRTISEVANWLDTPTHVLRFWESRFTQVKPVKRAGGRRYYRPRDMELLGGIKVLLHSDGMTIRGVQKLLREEGVKHVAAMSPPVDGSNVIDLKAADPVLEAPMQLDVAQNEPENVVPLKGAPVEDAVVIEESQSTADVAEVAADGTEQDAEPANPDQTHADLEEYQADKAAPAGTTPASVLKTNVPDDPSTDTETASPGILGVAAALRKASTSASATKPSPEVFGELYKRLSNLRDRMDSSVNADQTD